MRNLVQGTIVMAKVLCGLNPQPRRAAPARMPAIRLPPRGSFFPTCREHGTPIARQDADKSVTYACGCGLTYDH